MYGVIDIGSNTVRLSVFKVEDNRIKLLFNKKEVAGLGGYVDEKHRMTPRGIKKAINVLNEFKVIIDNVEIKEVYVFATASLRNLVNTMEAVEEIKEKTGFKIRVLSGREEAILDYFGAMQNVEMNEGILVDIGGGSTEIVFYKQKQILGAFSMPIGSLNTYANYVSGLIPNKSEIKRIKNAVFEELEKQEVPNSEIDTKLICGVGGTARAMCKLNNEFFDMPANNYSVETKNIKKIIDTLDNDDKKTLLKILSVTPERIHTIIPGMIILMSVTKYYKSKNIVISRCGVREGYLYDVLKERGVICGE